MNLRGLGSTVKHKATGDVMGKFSRRVLVATAVALSACSGNGEPDDPVAITFEEFEAEVPYLEDVDRYIVENDLLVDEQKLREYYDARVASPHGDVLGDDVGAASQPLIVMHDNGNDRFWPPATASNLTYCVGNFTPAATRTTVINAMNAAAAQWEAAAAVNFVHVTAQDGNCVSSNTNVIFNVRSFDLPGQTLASSFFPIDPRALRELRIDPALTGSANLTNVLIHELGHSLGFLHETGRQALTTSGAACNWEHGLWRPTTNFTSNSIMNCSGPISMQTNDRRGAACVYGAPAGSLLSCDVVGVEYRAHVGGLGNLAFVRNNDIAGTQGQSRGMQAISIRLRGPVRPTGICYQVHVDNLGDLPEVCNGAQAGTTGQNRNIQAIRIRLLNAPAGCSVQYQGHVSNLGWLSTVQDNVQAGTTGQSRAMQALRVNLTSACF
jgi:hypothetical protein